MYSKSRTIKIVAISVAGLAVLSAGAAAQLARAMVEQPDYEVLKKGDGYEIRKYPACIVAQVSFV